MATQEQLERALINADAAGDVEAAKALAAEVRRMRAMPKAKASPEMDLDPTSGMSGLEKFAAGYLGAAPKLWTGIQQTAAMVANNANKLPKSFGAIPGVGGALNLVRTGAQLAGVDDQTVQNFAQQADEQKRLDKPLLNTGAGMAGNIAGYLPLSIASTILAPGANTYTGSALLGGLFGLAEPTGQDESKVGHALGGAAMGAGAQAAGRVLGSLIKGGAAYLAPLTKKGQAKIVAETLRRFAENPDSISNAAAYQSAIPGVKPTLAEATLDPGLATLQLSVKNADPIAKSQIVRQELNNQAARLSALNDIAQTPAAREAAVAARDSAAETLYGKAFSSDAMRQDLAQQLLRERAIASTGGIGTPKQLEIAASQLREDLATPGLRQLAERPAFQSAIHRAKELAKDKGQTIGDPLQSLEGLHYIKLALDDMLEPSATNALGRNSKSAIAGMKQQLLEEIKSISPTYDAARAVYADMSRPINQMDVGRELYEKLVPALTENSEIPSRISAQQYANALRNAERTVKNSTGIAAPLENIMTPEQMSVIKGISSDLARKASADDLAKTLGSTTAQNLAAENLLRQTLGPLGAPKGWIEGQLFPNMATALTSPYKWFTKTDEAINQRLAQALMNPREAADLLSSLPTSEQSRLVEILSRAALPVSVGSRANFSE